MLQDIKKTSKHSFVYALGNMATKLSGLLLIPLYTNVDYLSTSEYGALAVLESTVTLLVGLLTMAMVQSLMRWYWDKNYEDKQKEIFFTTLGFLTLIVVPATSLLIWNSNHISNLLFRNFEFESVLRFTFITAGIQILNNQVFALARLQYKSLMYSSFQVVKFLIIIFLVIYGLKVEKKGLESIWIAHAIGEIVILILLLPFILKNVKPSFEGAILKEMFGYGIPLMLAAVSGVLLSVTDRYMLSSMSGLEDTGVYGLGYRLANTLKLVVSTSIMLAISPLRLQKINVPGNQRFYSKVLTYSGFIFVLAMLGLSLFSLEILKIFSSNKAYWSSGSIVPIISYALMFGLLKDNTIIGLTIKKQTKVIGGLIFTVSVLNIGLNFWLIPILNYYGAALATLGSQIVFFIVISIKAQKAYPIPYEWKKVGWMLLFSALIIGIGILINNWDVLARISLKVLMFIGFPFLLHLVGFYEKIELVTIKSIITQWKSPRNIKQNFKRYLKF